MTPMPEAGGDPIAVFVALTFYFMPTIIAAVRKHHNKISIGVLNTLLGWTVIGWVIALVWSFTKVEKLA